MVWQGMVLPLLPVGLQIVFKCEYSFYRFYSNLTMLILLKIINKENDSILPALFTCDSEGWLHHHACLGE